MFSSLHVTPRIKNLVTAASLRSHFYLCFSQAQHDFFLFFFFERDPFIG